MNVDISQYQPCFRKWQGQKCIANGTVITTRFIEHTTRRSILYNDLNSMTDALQFVVYCNYAIKLSESSKYIL
jgi:hypothetical protein